MSEKRGSDGKQWIETSEGLAKIIPSGDPAIIERMEAAFAKDAHNRSELMKKIRRTILGE